MAMRRHPLPECEPDCYACKLQSIRWGFTYGREVFHGPTDRERIKETIDNAREHGYNIAPKTPVYSGPLHI